MVLTHSRTLILQITGDANIGRALAEALTAIPTLDKDTFDKMFSSNLQDMLLAAHLANITRTQINIAGNAHPCLK